MGGSDGSVVGIILIAIAVVLLIVLLVWVRLCVVIVKQGTKKVVERFGVYRRTLSEGFHLILKPFDRIALNPWSAVPDEVVEALTSWDEEGSPDNDWLLSSEESKMMEKRLRDFSDNLSNATKDADKKYWAEVLKAEKDFWDDKIEKRLSERVDIGLSTDDETPTSVDGYMERKDFPSGNMNRGELRMTISRSNKNRRQIIKNAHPTGRYRITPAGYTRALDTHEILDYIDMRECFIDLGENPVITLDNASVGVNTCFFYQVTDVFRYYYGVDRPLEAIKKLTVTTLRNLIGSMTLEQTLISRKEVNSQLRVVLDEATNGWGIKINRVEIEELILSDDMKQAMNEVLIADRRRRVKLIDADAEAGYYLKLKDAEAEGYKKIKAANLDEKVLKIKGYEAVKHLADGQATKIFVPSGVNDVVTNSHIFADAMDSVINTGTAQSEQTVGETEGEIPTSEDSAEKQSE